MRAEKEELLKLVDERGKDALLIIAEKYCLEPKKTQNALWGMGIKFGREKQNSELERLALSEGLPLQAIGSTVKISKQAVHVYLKSRDLLDSWKKRKQELKLERRKCLEQIHYALLKRLISVAKQEGWAAEQATRVLLTPRLDPRKIASFEVYKKIFSAYESAAKKGEKPSLEEIAKKADLRWASESRWVLVRSLGRKALFLTREKKSYSKEINQAIARAYQLDMSARDIAHLIKTVYSADVDTHKVQNEFIKIGPRERKYPFIIQIKHSSGKRTLSYRKASEVFEAFQLGFNKAAISCLLDLEPKIVDSYLHHRRIIKNEMLRVLEVIRPDKGYSPIPWLKWHHFQHSQKQIYK